MESNETQSDIKENTEIKAEESKKAKRKRSAQKRDRIFLISTLILIFAILIALLISIGSNLWFSKDNIQASHQSNLESNLAIYSKLVDAKILLIQKDINNISRIIQSDNTTYSNDNASISLIESILQKNLPGSTSSRVFLNGKYELDDSSFPPINFSAQKQLLSAESTGETLPEFYTSSQGNYLGIAAAIRNSTTNELYFTIFATYPESFITSGFPEKTLEGTQISLIQSYERGGQQTIFRIGDATNRKESNIAPTLHPRWSVQYQSNQKTIQFNKLITASVISLFVSLAISVAAIFIGLKVIQKNLDVDVKLLLDFIKSDGKKSIQHNKFKTNTLQDIYTQSKKVFRQSQKIKNTTPIKLDNSDKDDPLFYESDAKTKAVAETNAEPDDITTDDMTNSINPSIFRAYDIRGIVGETLNANVVKLIGQAIGSMALSKGEKTVAIARDGRLSGPELIKALSEGIRASGANVIDCGMVPTPVLYFACKTLDTQSGVMLTGSHNPSNHNGLKMVINGTTLAQDAIQELRTNIETGLLSQGEGQLTTENLLPAYVQAIENDIVLAQTMDVVIDCGNGVAGVIAEKLFTQIGCDVTPLYTEVDGNFPNHHPDPSQPTNLQDLIAKVKETGAHLGVAFDGDGDRVGLVSNTGKIIWADRLMMLFSKDVLSRNPGADIIFDVKCSNTLADSIRAQGGRPLMWKTGHSLIKAKLKETNAPLAGEMSGHIFFNDRWYGFDDGLYSAARLIEILSTDSKSCDEIFAEFPEMITTPEINIAVDDELKFDLIEILSSHGDFGNGDKTDIDGIRIDYTDGWGLVRASNTTANIVTRFEADTDERLQEIKAIFKAQILKVQSDLDIPF